MRCSKSVMSTLSRAACLRPAPRWNG
jgi:hypothetical protein